jgi:hypothetical protein
MKKEKTMHELVKEFPDKSYRELEIYRDADRQEEAARIPLTESQQKQKELEPIEDDLGTCITASMQRDKVAIELQVMKRRAQEAEGELSILKGIETNRVKEAQDALANALAVNESHQKLNGKLQERLTELEEENKKINDHLDKRIESVRKSGM